MAPTWKSVDKNGNLLGDYLTVERALRRSRVDCKTNKAMNRQLQGDYFILLKLQNLQICQSIEKFGY